MRSSLSDYLMTDDDRCYPARNQIYVLVSSWARSGKLHDSIEANSPSLTEVFGKEWRTDENLHQALLGPHGYTVLKMALARLGFANATEASDQS